MMYYRATRHTLLHVINVKNLSVVMFGVLEDKNRQVWSKQVSDVLYRVAGRNVEIADAFRIVAYSPDRSRPVLVKLRSVWDKRLVLANCRILATCDDNMKKVFIVPDEPPETRKRKVLHRMKEQAIRKNAVWKFYLTDVVYMLTVGLQWCILLKMARLALVSNTMMVHSDNCLY